MTSSRTAALVDALATHSRLVEVGVGHRWAVATGLADRGCTVTATDIIPRDPPPGVTFRIDDVTSPHLSIYTAADAIYALRCPPELHHSLCQLGATVDAAVYFTTLGGDPPAVAVDPIALPRTTLYVPAGPWSSGANQQL